MVYGIQSLNALGDEKPQGFLIFHLGQAKNPARQFEGKN
jgi:hypothetical protein